MNKQLLACLALAALLPLTASAQERRATVSPSLEPLVQQPAREIPRLLRGPLGGGQGHQRLAGRAALSLHLRTRATREELEALGVQVRTLRNGRATVTVLPEDLAALASSPDVFSIALPRRLHPTLAKSLPDTGIPLLRTLSNGSFTGATGEGVVVGIIDYGIDVDHPNFEDALGNTRIAYLWDQTQTTAGHPAPAGFGYGTEWNASDIDAGVCTEQDDPLQYGHGTHVAGIAAGNGAAPDENGLPWTHVGVAPESTIIFVKSGLSTDEVVDGLEYIFAKADQLGLPAVVNLSSTLDIGAHDGTDPIEQTIDDLVTAQAGRAVVVAAGNSRDAGAHAEMKAQQGVQLAGPTFLIPAYTAKPGAGTDVVIVTGYYASTDDVTVQLITPTGEIYTRTLTNSDCATEVDGYDGTVQICNSKTSNIGQGTTAREIAILIYDGVESKPPRPGAWKIKITGNTVSGNGEVDFWVESDIAVPAYFSTLVDTSETVGIPSTSAQAITVGAHITRLCWTDYNGNSQGYGNGFTLGDIAPFSGFGPTRDGRPKPEISAPGMGIVAPLAAEAKTTILNFGDGDLIVNDHYLLLEGTSMAAPHVTGAVALLLQDNPAATNATLRSLLSSGARDDAYTRQYDAAIFPYLNPAFGAGKLDLGRWAWVDPYESNDLPAQAYALLSGQTLGGYVERTDDVDYFLLQGVQSGDTINASLTSLPQDFALALQAQGIALNNCGPGGMSTKASSNNAGTANESISYTTTVSYPFLQGVAAYVRVTSSAGATSNSDSYQVKAILTRQETTSAHAGTATAQKLPGFVEMNVAGAISAAEQDYYSFSIMQGKTMVLTAAGKTITIRDVNGAFVKSGSGSVTYTVPTGGFISLQKTYHAVVSGANGGYTLNLKIQ
jgi:subtilisin family serine protease